MVPIVMGAPKEDYEKVAPPHSFIHVDDFRSPRHLAEYLHLLDKDDVLYNQYFEWRSRGWFIDTLFFCRLCAMIHLSAETGHVTWQENLREWWNRDQCIKPNTWASWTQESVFVDFVPNNKPRELYDYQNGEARNAESPKRHGYL